MERGDLATIAAGIILVIFISLVVKGGYVLPSREAGPETTPVPETVPAAGTVAPLPVVSQPTTSPGIVPVRITYARNPLEYPNIKIPDFMETFGGSDIPWKDPAVVRFAEFQ